jgi:hypothetical protein
MQPKGPDEKSAKDGEEDDLAKLVQISLGRKREVSSLGNASDFDTGALDGNFDVNLHL